MSSLTGQHKCHIHGMENVTLTSKEQARLQVLNILLAEHMTLDQAAMLMGVTTRHTRRMLATYREEGAVAVVHGHRGRQPPNATPDAVVADVVHLARTRYEGANHTHLSELLSERAGIRHRPDHPAAHPGEGRAEQSTAKASAQAPGPPPAYAPGGHADPDGRQSPPVVGGPGAAFRVADRSGRCHRYGGRRLLLRAGGRPSYFLLIQGLVQHLGVPVALYTDRHAVFKHTPGSGLPELPTQFSRAMEELGIQMIFARSPQAKGRVERTAGTFQDRLVTKLRLAGASSIGAANRVLEQFLPRFNRRFQVPPQHPEPAFRSLDPELCLDQILCFKHRRKVAKDNTVRFQLHTLQLLPGPERPSYAGGGGGGPGRTGRPAHGAATKGTLLLPRRHHPVRYFSATATGVPPLLLSCHPAPTAWANTGQRLSNRWTQGQRTRTATL